MYKTIIAEDGKKYNLVPVTEPTPAQQKKKWEPKGWEWYVNSEWDVDNWYSTRDARVFGTEYQTKELAEKARDSMRIHNLLLSRKMEECPNDGDYFIYCEWGQWSCEIRIKGTTFPDTVLFTHTVADKICEELNDPELNFLNI